MNITIQKKSLGRSRKLSRVEYELPREPQTLRELLHLLVAIEVTRYAEADTVIQFLTEEQEMHVGELGSAKFSSIIPHEKRSLEESIHIMEQAFEDGLFKVVQDRYVYESLDESLDSAASNWTFIKLTFLAGA